MPNNELDALKANRYDKVTNLGPLRRIDGTNKLFKTSKFTNNIEYVFTHFFSDLGSRLVFPVNSLRLSTIFNLNIVAIGQFLSVVMQFEEYARYVLFDARTLMKTC
jgi:hypothetical protein